MEFIRDHSRDSVLLKKRKQKQFFSLSNKNEKEEKTSESIFFFLQAEALLWFRQTRRNIVYSSHGSVNTEEKSSFVVVSVISGSKV